MGIDCMIVNYKGEPTSLLGEDGPFHIACAIEHVTDQPFHKTKNECYDIIYECTGIHISTKYDQDDHIWTTDEIRDMLTSIEEEDDSAYKVEIITFLTFICNHELSFDIY